MYILVKCHDLAQNQAILKLCDELGLYSNEYSKLAVYEADLDSIKEQIATQKNELASLHKAIDYHHNRHQKLLQNEKELCEKIKFLQTRCKHLKTQYRKYLPSKPSKK